MIDIAEWMTTADVVSKVRNRMNETNEPTAIAENFTEWRLQFYVSQTSEHFGRICNHDSCAVLDILLTSYPGCIDAFVKYEVMEKGEINVAGVTNRETVVPGVVKDVRKKLIDHVNKMISVGLMRLDLLNFGRQLPDQIDQHDDTIKLMLAYLKYFWCSTSRNTEHTEGYDIVLLAYHNNF